MSMIVCNKCQFEWLAKDTVFEELVLDEASGTKMRYFQCPECGEEYIVDVTDKELRKQISVFKKMKRKYIRMYSSQESEVRLRNYGVRMETAQAEILAREKELRTRWTSGK